MSRLKTEGVMRISCSLAISEAIGENVSWLQQQKMSAYWKRQYYGMTTKSSSSSGLTSAIA